MTQAPTKKERIFIEAAKLFQTKGYAATSMRDLAEHVGLKPSSFYSHIKSKEEILERICTNAAIRFHEGLLEVIEQYNNPTDQFKAIIDLHIAIAFEDPSAITVFNDEWRHLSGTAIKTFRNKRKAYQDAVIGIVKKSMATGDSKQLDATIVFNTIIGATRWLHFLKDPSPAMRRKISDQLKTMLLKGIEQ